MKHTQTDDEINTFSLNHEKNRKAEMFSISTSTSTLVNDTTTYNINQKNDKETSTEEVSIETQLIQKQAKSILILDLSILLLSTAIFSFAMGFFLALFQCSSKE